MTIGPAAHVQHLAGEAVRGNAAGVGNQIHAKPSLAGTCVTESEATEFARSVATGLEWSAPTEIASYAAATSLVTECAAPTSAVSGSTDVAPVV